MKKDEFKKSIDNITPDAYMGNRIKSKINSNIPIRSNRRVTVSITAFCLAFAIIFGVAFLTPTTAPTGQTTTDSSVVEKRINPFIIVASAAEVQNTEVGLENKVLELNEEYPYKMYLEVKDVSGISDEEKNQNEIVDLKIFKENQGDSEDVKIEYLAFTEENILKIE